VCVNQLSKGGVAFMQTYKLLKQDSVLLSQPILIENFGRAGAQFLSQLHYWLEKDGPFGHEHQGIRWIYNSAESWAEQLHLSVRQVRRLISRFLESGVLRVQKLNPCKSIRTNYYSIDYDALDAAVAKRSQTRCFSHSDILSSSSCHNDTIYIETKITNKDFNKSEKKSKKLAGQGDISEIEQVKQVKPVKKVIAKVEKGRKDEDKNTSQSPNPKNSQPKRSTAQDMLRVWNTILGEKAQAIMNKDLAPLLVSAFSTKFGKDIEQWKRYCDLIKTSDYLMKEGFDLSIFWVLKFSTIDRLWAGGLGVKPASLGSTSEVIISEHQTEEMINNLNESEKVKALRRTIAQAIGFANYLSWFHHASFVEQNGKILLIAPNAFVENIWAERFGWIHKENNL